MVERTRNRAAQRSHANECVINYFPMTFVRLQPEILIRVNWHHWGASIDRHSTYLPKASLPYWPRIQGQGHRFPILTEYHGSDRTLHVLISSRLIVFTTPTQPRWQGSDTTSSLPQIIPLQLNTAAPPHYRYRSIRRDRPIPRSKSVGKPLLLRVLVLMWKQVVRCYWEYSLNEVSGLHIFFQNTGSILRRKVCQIHYWNLVAIPSKRAYNISAQRTMAIATPDTMLAIVKDNSGTH